MKTFFSIILMVISLNISGIAIASGNEKPDNAPQNTKKFNGHHDNNFQFNVDFGINNFLEDGTFPDENGALYAVRPWGSWYVGLGASHLSRIGGPLFLKVGAFVDWYNFKFLNENARLARTGQEVAFFELDDPLINSEKSKLTLSYLNLKAVPTFYIGGDKKRGSSNFLDWDNKSNGLRIGAGGYIGYRLDAYTKAQYKIEGDKEKERVRENYFTNNFRYGVRFELGFSDLDFFFNYDLNDLFVENKGPQLNPISFGITF